MGAGAVQSLDAADADLDQGTCKGEHLMSYDFNTMPEPCDHSQTRERYIVDQNDFRTLHLAANPSINMRAPINSSDALQLYISGELVSPSDPTYGYTLQFDPNRIDTFG